jgi:hypothetical protein
MKKIFVFMLMALLLTGIVFAQPNDNSTMDKKQEFKNWNEQIKERYNVAKERYANSKENYSNAQNKWQEFRDRVKEKAEGVLHSKEGRGKSKDFLEKMIEKMIDRIEVIKLHIELRPETDLRAETLAKLDGFKEEIIGFKDQVEDLNSADEIKEFAKELKGIWKETHLSLKKHGSLVLAEKIDNLLERVNNVMSKISAKLDGLETAGYDVSELKQDFLELNEGKYVDAKLLLETAKTNFENAAEDGSNEELREAHKELVKANKALREVHKEIKVIVKGMVKTINKQNLETSDDDLDVDNNEPEDLEGESNE